MAKRNTELQEAIRKLAALKVEDTHTLKQTLKANSRRWGGGWYESGDEQCPFFSEAVLYTLLGKEDARSVLAYFGQVVRLAGLGSLRDLGNDEEKEGAGR